MEAIPWLVREAFAQLGSGRPRPAALEVPCDVLDSDRPARPARTPGRRSRSNPDRRNSPGPADCWRRPAGRSSGPGAESSGPAPRQRADRGWRSGCILLSSPPRLGKGAIPGRSSPLRRQCTLLHPDGQAYLRTCDLMLAVGTRFKEIETERWRLKLPEQLIHIDIDPAEIGRNYGVSAAVVGHASPALEGLLELCRGATTTRDRPREVKELRGRIWCECLQRAAGGSGDWWSA